MIGSRIPRPRDRYDPSGERLILLVPQMQLPVASGRFGVSQRLVKELEVVVGRRVLAVERENPFKRFPR